MFLIFFLYSDIFIFMLYIQLSSVVFVIHVASGVIWKRFLFLFKYWCRLLNFVLWEQFCSQHISFYSNKFGKAPAFRWGRMYVSLVLFAGEKK